MHKNLILAAIIPCVVILILLCSPQLYSFMDGEKLTFDIKYGFIGAGQATLHAEEINYRDNIPAYKITSTARTNRFFDRIFKVRDEIESIMDKERLVSHQYTKRLEEGRYRQYRIHYYYPEHGYTHYMRYSFSDQTFTEERLEIPSETQDILSAFYWFRMQNAAPGDTLIVNITTDGENYDAGIVVNRKETIKTIFGQKECLVIEPLLEGEALFQQTGSIYIWVTNDEYKIPVRLESKVIFGSFTATLSEAKNVPY